MKVPYLHLPRQPVTQPKVGQFDIHVQVQQHVGWLQVLVCTVAGMTVVHGQNNLDEQ